MKNVIKNFLIFFFIFIVISALFYSVADERGAVQPADIGQLVEKINRGEITSIVIKGDTLQVESKDAGVFEVKKETGESLSSLLSNFGVTPEKLQTLRVEVQDESGLSFWLATLLPFVLPLLIIGVFLYIMMRQVQGANGRALMFGQ